MYSWSSPTTRREPISPMLCLRVSIRRDTCQRVSGSVESGCRHWKPLVWPETVQNAHNVTVTSGWTKYKHVCTPSVTLHITANKYGSSTSAKTSHNPSLGRIEFYLLLLLLFIMLTFANVSRRTNMRPHAPLTETVPCMWACNPLCPADPGAGWTQTDPFTLGVPQQNTRRFIIPAWKLSVWLTSSAWQ